MSRYFKSFLRSAKSPSNWRKPQNYKQNRNKDGWGWRRLRHIMNGELEHFQDAQTVVKPWVILTFESVDETLVCDHSNESYRAVLSCGAVSFWQFWKVKFQIFPLSFELSTLRSERVKAKGFYIVNCNVFVVTPKIRPRRQYKEFPLGCYVHSRSCNNTGCTETLNTETLNPFTPKGAKFKTDEKLLNYIFQYCQKQTAPHESTAFDRLNRS